jgi:Lon protease-like protein
MWSETAEGEVEPFSEEELARLPVFPLPNAVFFPATSLPLHVFERRYRRMVEDCVAQGPLAMIVTLLRPGWERDYEGRPDVHTIAGAGRIVGHHRLADGRHNLLLRGVCRVELTELDAGTLPYRVASARALSDEGTVDRHAVQALLACTAPIVAAVRREHPEFDLGIEPGDPPGVVADRAADRLLADVALRQRVIETLDVGERIRMVTDAVGELMAMLSTRRRGEPLD